MLSRTRRAEELYPSNGPIPAKKWTDIEPLMEGYFRPGDGAYAYRFFDFVEVRDMHDGLKVTYREENSTPWFYTKGEIRDYDEIEQTANILSKLEPGDSAVVIPEVGAFKLEDGDKVIKQFS